MCDMKQLLFCDTGCHSNWCGSRFQIRSHVFQWKQAAGFLHCMHLGLLLRTSPPGRRLCLKAKNSRWHIPGSFEVKLCASVWLMASLGRHLLILSFHPSTSCRSGFWVYNQRDLTERCFVARFTQVEVFLGVTILHHENKAFFWLWRWEQEQSKPFC